MADQKLSPAQRRVLRLIAWEPNGLSGGSVPLGGNKRAPVLSAARSLVRRGICHNYRTSHFGLTPEGIPLAVDEVQRWNDEREAARAAEHCEPSGLPSIAPPAPLAEVGP